MIPAPNAQELDQAIERQEALLFRPDLRAYRMFDDGIETSAAAVATAAGVIGARDCLQLFTFMSTIKPFLLLRVLQVHGREQVARWVDELPSDLPYYSAPQLIVDGGKPRNAMINSGAMVLASKLPGGTPQEQQEAFVEWLAGFVGPAGTRPTLHEELRRHIMAEELGGENGRLARLLVEAGYAADAGLVLDIYFRVCCLLTTLPDLAMLGLALARSEGAAAAQVRRAMQCCGLYEASQEWTRSGLPPAKSGVSGAVFALLPGPASIAVGSPWLDGSLNPLLPMAVIRDIFGS